MRTEKVRYLFASGFGAATAGQPMGCAQISSCGSTRESDLKSVFWQCFLVSEKHRVVCAVLSSGHFDIGVVHENG